MSGYFLADIALIACAVVVALVVRLAARTPDGERELSADDFEIIDISEQ